MSAYSFFRWLGATKRFENDETDYEARLRWAIELPLVVIDEVGRESQSEATEQLRHEFFNRRYQAAMDGIGGATVITTNLHPDALPGALASRVMEKRFVRCLAPTTDWRRR